ncbi:uncharacterized protein LOC143083804 isoform X1 [Mytilus galloprovincialis]|uniref:uncharacterized protein LOC143083804 isoform X1 n=2 Tax=Mytilus galloprovincialis TaxID=29158 RepID=UPI003F7B375C
MMPLSDFIWSVQTHTNGIKRKISGDACSQESLEQQSKKCRVISPAGDFNVCEMDDENHNEMSSQNFNSQRQNHRSESESQTILRLQGQQQLTCPSLLASQPDGQGFLSQQPTGQEFLSQQPTGQGFLSQPSGQGFLTQQPSHQGLLLQQSSSSILPHQSNPDYLSQTGPCLSLHDQQNNMIMNINEELYSCTSLLSEEEMACTFMESDFVPNQQQYNARDNSVVGDSTPTIDRVKCYCRPSWEGTFDMKPYVSDYY